MASIKEIPITRDVIEYIIMNLRREDLEEAESDETQLTEFVDFIENKIEIEGAFVTGFAINDEPVCIIGSVPVWSGVRDLFTISTNKFGEIAIAVTRWAKNVLTPALKQSGAHRVHSYSLKKHEKVHRWLEMLGAEREAELRKFGANKEDYVIYVWRER